MKKTIFTSVLVLAVSGYAFAQGNVNWTGPSAAAITAQTNAATYSWVTGGGAAGGSVGVTTGAASLGTGFYFALLINSYSGSQLAQPTTLSALNTWQFSGLYATNNPAPASAGRLVVEASNSGTTVPLLSSTVTNSIMLVGWSANLGTTWSAVSTLLNNWSTQGSSVVGAAYFGTSSTGYIVAADTATSPGAAVFGTAATANGLPIFSVNTQLNLLAVPEPSTMVLAGLGGLSLLAFRRKK